MPYRSKRQIGACFGLQLAAEKKHQNWTWDCKKWLEETPRPDCLPSLVGSPKPSCPKRPKRGKEISPVYEGPRGGLYFYAGSTKIYVPRGTESIAIKKYKFGGKERK